MEASKVQEVLRRLEDVEPVVWVSDDVAVDNPEFHELLAELDRLLGEDNWCFDDFALETQVIVKAKRGGVYVVTADEASWHDESFEENCGEEGGEGVELEEVGGK